MSADPVPEESASDSAGGAVEERHLHPVPDDGPVPDETTAQSLDEVASAEPDASATAPDGAEAAPSRFRVDLSALLAWARSTFTPQSGMWTQRPLAPDEVMDRARRGSHLADAGPLRTAAIADSYVAAGTKAALRCGDWLLDHPARRVVAAVLLTALLLYPPTRTALGWALAPAAWAHGLLT